MIPTNELVKLLKTVKIIDIQKEMLKRGVSVSAASIARLRNGDMTTNHSVIQAVSDYFED